MPVIVIDRIEVRVVFYQIYRVVQSSSSLLAGWLVLLLHSAAMYLHTNLLRPKFNVRMEMEWLLLLLLLLRGCCQIGLANLFISPKNFTTPLDYIFMRQCHVITWRHSPTAIPSRGGTSFAISQGINFKQQSLIFIVNVNTARHLSVTNQLRKRPSWCLMNKGDPVLLNLKGCCPSMKAGSSNINVPPQSYFLMGSWCID